MPDNRSISQTLQRGIQSQDEDRGDTGFWEFGCGKGEGRLWKGGFRRSWRMRRSVEVILERISIEL